MWKLMTVLVFVLLCVPLSSSIPTSMSKRQNFHLCGPMLVETLLMICGGEIYGPGLEKREEKAADYSLGSYLGIPETGRTELDSNPKVYRRQMSGIAEECCTNSCSLSTLASYCAK